MVERGRMSQRSQRSQGTGTSSSSSQDSKKCCKNCCRKFISFMCTQVGVGGLVVSYAIMGSFAFIAIEGKPELNVYNQTLHIHERAIKEMWKYTVRLNVLHKGVWYRYVNDTLYEFQTSIVNVVKDGYNDMAVEDIWTFPASLMFCLSVFSMIGYGHMTPKTDWGKIATILYAVLGIPLYIVYFMSMGKLFANTFKFLYRSLYRCLNKDKMKATTELENEAWEHHHVIIVPSTACIWVMIFYMTVGTIMFAEWENWSYLDSCYFSFTSLAKIGIGDFVPGIGGTEGTTKDSQTKLIINFMFLLIGMALIAMCYTLMKEEIMMKVHAAEREMKEKLYILGLQIGLYEGEPQKGQTSPQRAKLLRRTVRRR